MLKLIYVSIIFFFITIPSYAYLGPGMGGGPMMGQGQNMMR